MAVRKKNLNGVAKTGNLLHDLADHSIQIKTTKTGKQELIHNKTIAETDRSKDVVQYVADVEDARLDLSDGTYFSGGAIQNLMTKQEASTRAKNPKARKMLFTITGANGETLKIKKRIGDPLTNSDLNKMNNFYGRQESLVLPDQATVGAGSPNMEVVNRTRDVNGAPISKGARVSLNDQIQQGFMNEDQLGGYVRLNNFQAEELPSFPNNKFGIVARTAGNLVKRYGLQLGLAGASVATIATHGTAISSAVLGAVTSGAFWAGLGTFAVGAAPVVACAVGAGYVINKVAGALSSAYKQAKADAGACRS